jgi:alkylation response protein AidB-like acyl-CoA dehydrogenase
MNYSSTPEQRMLADFARSFLEAHYPLGRVVEVAERGGFEKSWWREIADLGWTGVSAPEDAGGTGLGFAEEAAIVEELGRALFPGPFLSTVTMASPGLALAPDLLKEIVAGDAIATLAWAGEDGEYRTSELPVRAGRGASVERLSGSCLFVPDLMLADLAVVAGEGAGGPSLWAVRLDRNGLSRRQLTTVDATRPLGLLTLDGTEGRLLADGEEAIAVLEHTRDRTLAALAVEAIGVASRALEMAVQYARMREQFGRPVGAFQAVAQQLAEAYAEVESGRSIAMLAVSEVSEATAGASRSAAAAKAFGSEVAVATCERAIQVHGGIGFTWEHPLHRYYRRALWIQAFFGWPAELRERVAADLLDGARLPEGGS